MAAHHSFHKIHHCIPLLVLVIIQYDEIVFEAVAESWLDAAVFGYAMENCQDYKVCASYEC